jgi:16S rRNA (cytosine967-C5)-methyltransferase
MIVEQSVRRWRTLEYILEAVSGHRSHELQPRMRAVLLGGAAQLLLLDRVPPHAILDESVSWAKRYVRQGAGGMVNAVLRKVARVRGEFIDANWDHHIDAIPLSEGGILQLQGLELPEHGRRRLGIACSIQSSLLSRWETMYEDPTGHAMHTLFKAPTVLFAAHAHGTLPTEFVSAHESENHRVFEGSRSQLSHLLSEHPDVWVQDPASSATLSKLDLPVPPKRVIDLCAGQGTKTKQLRAMFPQAEIVACEVDAKRLRVLREQFETDSGVRVIHVSDMTDSFAGWADFVLTDVPCSNTGVLARRLEARYRPVDKQLARLVETQRAIGEHAIAVLEDRGTLVYATCSVEIEENEGNVDWIHKNHGLELIHQQRIEPRGEPGDAPEQYQDASFAAVLRKPG